LEEDRIKRTGKKKGTKYSACEKAPSSSDITDIFNLERSPLFSRILTYRKENRRLPEIVPNQQIEDLKKLGREYIQRRIQEGNEVTIKEGLYKNMTGRVVHQSGIYVVVQINLRSIEILTRVPFFIVDNLDE